MTAELVVADGWFVGAITNNSESRFVGAITNNSESRFVSAITNNSESSLVDSSNRHFWQSRQSLV